MFKKNGFSAGRCVWVGFLAVVLMGLVFQPALAADGDDYGFQKKFKLGVNLGATFTSEAGLSKDAHENILVIIRIPWPWPWPDPPWWEVDIEVGYNAFQWDLGAYDEKFYWWNINPTLRFTFGSGKFNPYISAGPGLYIPEEGDSRIGFKGGVGFDYKLSDRMALELGIDYHYISLKEEMKLAWDSSFDFFHSHIGIVISF